MWNANPMTWEVEYTDEFETWWDSLTEAEQMSVAATVELLEEQENLENG